MRGTSRVHNTSQAKATETSYRARQYGFDVQHEWDFRDGKDYLIAGVTGKQEILSATAVPVYIHLNAIVMLCMVVILMKLT